MNYVPQIPKWGEEYIEKKLDDLVSYHGWLTTTAIKTGLISQKKEQGETNAGTSHRNRR